MYKQRLDFSDLMRYCLVMLVIQNSGKDLTFKVSQ